MDQKKGPYGYQLRVFWTHLLNKKQQMSGVCLQLCKLKVDGTQDLTPLSAQSSLSGPAFKRTSRCS